MRVTGLVAACSLLALANAQIVPLTSKDRAARQYDAAAKSAGAFHELILASLADTSKTRGTFEFRRGRDGKIERIVANPARFGLMRVGPMTLRHGSSRYLIPYQTNGFFIGARGKAVTAESARIELLASSRLVSPTLLKLDPGSAGNYSAKPVARGGAKVTPAPLSKALTPEQNLALKSTLGIFRSNAARLSSKGLRVEDGQLTYDFKAIPAAKTCLSCHRELKSGEALGYIAYTYPNLKTLSEQHRSNENRNRIVLGVDKKHRSLLETAAKSLKQGTFTIIHSSYGSSIFVSAKHYASVRARLLKVLPSAPGQLRYRLY
ncbi:MAG: hypothetical protein ABL949_02560 [Fimbriimonadaceae bacterium]